MNKKDKSFCLSINVCAFLFIIFYFFFGICYAETSSKKTLSTRRIAADSVDELFKNSLIIDGVLNYTVKQDPECRKDCKLQNIDLGLIKGLTGIDVGSLTIPSPVEKLIAIHDYVSQEQSEGGLVVKRFNDLEKAKREKKYGVIFYAQQHAKLDGSVAPIRQWFDYGLRIVQIHYSSQDSQSQSPLEKLGGGSDEPYQGLTELGKRAVKQLNRLNMIIDLSHCSEKTTMDVIHMTNIPVMANHANAMALTSVSRNKSDTELMAIAKSGGVIGVTPIAWMIDRDGDGKGNIDDFIAHVDYIVHLVGLDHVGVASDSVLDGWGVEDRHYADNFLASFGRWKIAARKLQDELGYSDLQLKKIFGLNFKRIYEQILPGLTSPKLLVPQDYASIPQGNVRFEWELSEYRGLDNLRKKKIPSIRRNPLGFNFLGLSFEFLNRSMFESKGRAGEFFNIGPLRYDLFIEKKTDYDYVLERSLRDLNETIAVVDGLPFGSEYRWYVKSHIWIKSELIESESNRRFFTIRP